VVEELILFPKWGKYFHGDQYHTKRLRVFTDETDARIFVHKNSRLDDDPVFTPVSDTSECFGSSPSGAHIQQPEQQLTSVRQSGPVLTGNLNESWRSDKLS
jgi:hypothetical protein